MVGSCGVGRGMGGDNKSSNLRMRESSSLQDFLYFVLLLEFRLNINAFFTFNNIMLLNENNIML